jgi:hypothetical protein
MGGYMGLYHAYAAFLANHDTAPWNMNENGIELIHYSV